MKTDFTLRLATQGDMWDIYELANSPEVRSVSIHSTPISRAEHEKWYLAKLADKSCKLFVISNQTKDFIGTVRFDLTDSKEFTITIYLVKEFRGKGLGTRIINQSSHILVKDFSDHKIKAEILENNHGSLNSFLKAGYKQVSTQSLAGKSFLILEYNP